MKNKIVLNSVKNLINTVPIYKIQFFSNEIVVFVDPKKLFNLIHFLKYHTLLQYKVLSCVSGVDYPNKKLKQKGSFLLGKEDGEWMFYSEDGNLNLIGYYSSGTRVGQWTGYHSINKIKSISFYHKGKKNGMAYGYDLSGKLVEIGVFVDGKIYYSN